MAGNRKLDWPKVGDTFGLLTVIQIELRMPLTPTQVRKGKRSGDRAVLARCRCGRERPLRLASLHRAQPVQGCQPCRLKDHHKPGELSVRAALVALWEWEEGYATLPPIVRATVEQEMGKALG